MLTYKECLDLAKQKLAEAAKNHPQYVIWEEKTITKDYGWIFLPSTESFIKTGDRSSLVPGMSQIIVNKLDSTCFMIPSFRPPESFILEYEKKLKHQENINVKN